MTDVLAWTGAALSTLLGLPQAVRALRSDSVGHAPDRVDTWSVGRLPNHPYAGV